MEKQFDVNTKQIKINELLYQVVKHNALYNFLKTTMVVDQKDFEKETVLVNRKIIRMIYILFVLVSNL